MHKLYRRADGGAAISLRYEERNLYLFYVWAHLRFFVSLRYANFLIIYYYYWRAARPTWRQHRRSVHANCYLSACMHWLFRLRRWLVTATSCEETASWREMTHNACMAGCLASTNHWRLQPGPCRPAAGRSDALTARNICRSPRRLHNERRRRVHSVRPGTDRPCRIRSRSRLSSYPCPTNPLRIFPRPGSRESGKTLRARRLLDAGKQLRATNSSGRPEMKNSAPT